jgi:hypothetical protein
MVTYSTETAFILHLLKDIYKTPKIQCPQLPDVDVNKLLLLAARNNVGYYTAKILSDTYGDQLPATIRLKLDKIIKQSETLLLALHETVAILDTNLDQYLLHKTYRGYPRIPSDIDTLVPDLHAAAEKLQSAGLKLKEDEGNAVMLIDNNGVKVHLHGEISWANSVFFDKEFVFQNPRTVNLWNMNVKIPSFDADLLIHIAHITYEPLHFTLSDFLYICKLTTFVNWTALLHQAKKHQWLQSFIRTISLIDEYNQALYPPQHTFDSLNLRYTPNNNETIVFPKDLPRTQIVLAFLEKRPFSYSLSKFSKAAQIIVNGDTHQAYYHPPEFRLISETLNNEEQK